MHHFPGIRAIQRPLSVYGLAVGGVGQLGLGYFLACCYAQFLS